MRKLMISGALMGFVSGLAFGLVRANSWPVILGRASAASFCAGLLMRWWGRVWLSSFQQSQFERSATTKAKQSASSSLKVS
jgi:hypothetical protein